MATFTTQRSGNSSDTNPATSPWSGGTPPGDGDVVVVATGHILTIDANLTLGSTSSNVGSAITINATDQTTYGKVIVATGVTLTLKGRDLTTNMLMNITRYAVFEPHAGSTIIGDVPSSFASIIRVNGIINADGRGGDPITFTIPTGSSGRNWNAQVTNEVRSSTAYEYDHQRSALPLSNPWVANAAGTGPGSFGDTSLSFSSKTPSTVCATEVATIDEVNGTGKYWVNYDMGHVVFWHTNSVPSLTCTYKRLDTTAGNWRGWGIVASSANTYNEAFFFNCVIEYMGNATDADSSALAVISRHSPSSTANRSFTVQGCTFRNCFRAMRVRDCHGTESDPLLIDGNTFQTCLPAGQTYSSPTIGCYRSQNDYLTISNNTLNIRYTLYSTISYPNTVSSTGLKILNNTGYCTQLITGGAISSPFPGLVIDGNDISANGNGINSGASGTDRIIANASGTAANRAKVSNNRFLYMVRLAMLGQYIDYEYNLVGYAYHHGIVGCGGDDLLVANPRIRYNVFIGDGGFDGPMIETGYNQRQHIDQIEIYNNTSVGPDKGFFGLGDCQDAGSYSLVTRAKVYNNLVIASGAGSYGMQRSTDISTRRTFAGLDQHDFNWYYGPASTYQNFNRGGTVSKGGENYSLGTRNVTGVSLYDPSVSSFSGKTLALTVTNPASDVTLVWDGGVAQQLIFGSYTVSSAAAGGTTADNATVTVSGTPWSTTVGDAAWPKLCWLKFTSGALAGTARAITNNTANVLTLAPGLSPLPAASDTFVIVRSQVTLTATGGSTIVAGIDARFLPATTQSDTDISFVSTDIVGTDPQLVNGTSANITGSRLDYAPLLGSPLFGAGFEGADIGAIAAPSATAVFEESDIVTQGDWIGEYGEDGYDIAADASDYPAYVLSETHSGLDVWPDFTPNSAKYLQKASNPAERAGGVIYSTGPAPEPMLINLEFSEGEHLLSVYVFDADDGDRTQQFVIRDYETGIALDTRTVSNLLAEPVYLTWRVSGHIQIENTPIEGSFNSYITGLFFDPVESEEPPEEPPGPAGPKRRLSPGTPLSRVTTREGILTRVGSITVFGTPGTATRRTGGRQGSPVSGRQQ